MGNYSAWEPRGGLHWPCTYSHLSFPFRAICLARIHPLSHFPIVRRWTWPLSASERASVWERRVHFHYCPIYNSPDYAPRSLPFFCPRPLPPSLTLHFFFPRVYDPIREFRPRREGGGGREGGRESEGNFFARRPLISQWVEVEVEPPRHATCGCGSGLLFPKPQLHFHYLGASKSNSAAAAPRRGTLSSPS